jgi:hypothetical protein
MYWAPRLKVAYLGKGEPISTSQRNPSSNLSGLAYLPLSSAQTCKLLTLLLALPAVPPSTVSACLQAGAYDRTITHCTLPCSLFQRSSAMRKLEKLSGCQPCHVLGQVFSNNKLTLSHTHAVHLGKHTGLYRNSQRRYGCNPADTS